MRRFPSYSILTISVLSGIAIFSQVSALASNREALQVSTEIPHSASLPSSHFALQGNASGTIAGSGVTTDEVGDADSFGRNLLWLGTSHMLVGLGLDCSALTPGAVCPTPAPAPAYTNFSYTNLGHIVLPKNATRSQLCYWLSPVLDVTYNNPTTAPVVALLHFDPTLTVENPVLATPGLIDATTGLPFDGKLTASMTSNQHFEVPLPAGLRIREHKRDSAVCMDGFLKHRQLVDTYGLTDSQAWEFFKQPMTVRLNLEGRSQYVDTAYMMFGFRIIGD